MDTYFFVLNGRGEGEDGEREKKIRRERENGGMEGKKFIVERSMERKRRKKSTRQDGKGGEGVKLK